MVNEAQIACALERYRLAHGEYPETLDALVPQFIEKVPHDIIGGGAAHLSSHGKREIPALFRRLERNGRRREGIADIPKRRG